MGTGSRLKQGSGEREWWAVKSVFSGSHLRRSLNHSPSETARLLHVDTHCFQLIRCVTQRVSMTEAEPDSSSPLQPATLPSLRNTHPHRHIHSYPCFPSVTLFSADSSVASPKGRPLIATVRWDGPLGIEFQMTGLWSWYGHSGSCRGTVLPLLWPAPRPLSQPAEPQFKPISRSGARTTRRDGSVTWHIHLAFCLFVSNLFIPQDHPGNIHLHYWFICQAKKKKEAISYFFGRKHAVGELAKVVTYKKIRGQKLKISHLHIKASSAILRGIVSRSRSFHAAVSF